MNKFSFLQTGDWHLGRPFRRFDEALATRLRQARRDSIRTCAQEASARGLSHVFVAGDLFDTRDAAPATWREALTVMKRDPSLTWHIIPGNHDFHQSGGMWDAIAKEAGETVRIYLSPTPVEIADGVWLLPAPMISRAQSADPTTWMSDAETPNGALRIGLAHGSIDGTGGDQTAVPIISDAAERARLDYLALGDWHGVKQVGPRTWYAGTPEPLVYKDNGAGHALAVDVATGRDPRVEVIPTARHAWVAEEFVDSPNIAIDHLRAAIDALGSKASNALVRLRGHGVLAPEADASVRSAIENISALVMHAQFDDRDVEVGLNEAQISRLDVDPALKPVMNRLAMLRASAADASHARVAGDALRALQAYASQTGVARGAED